MILGAIFAGGQARRFGSDKAAAIVGGRTLLDRAADALRPHCADLVVVGRDWPGLCRVEDRPAPGLGPLGALCGALAHARDHGFDRVLTSGCDLPDFPADLDRLLTPAPAIIAGQPLLGSWPVSYHAALLDHIARGERRLQGWVRESGARRVPLDRALPNINTREDLARYERGDPPIAADRRSSR